MAEHSHTAHRPGRHRAGRASVERPAAARHRGPRGTVWETRLSTAVTVTAATVGAAAAVGTVSAPVADAASGNRAAASSSEESPAARAARAEPLAPGTPCSESARACVDLDSQRAWLIDDGEVVGGPMPISSGARGYETPIGHSFRVYRQEIDHVSRESTTPDGRPAPMPYSTFFADGGVAFHGGSLTRASAGCVHLSTADARAVYEHLQNGDKVQVVRASQERAARRALA